MDLPISGQMHTIKSIQDTAQTPDTDRIPLRDQGRGAIDRDRRVFISDETGNVRVINADAS